MEVGRCSYFIPSNQTKTDGKKLTDEDLINIGYMAGRYGISLDGDLNRNVKPEISDEGVKLNINCCTTELFEENLKNSGIKFDTVA